MTAKNHENNNSELTQQTINFANGVINMLKSVSFSHQLVEEMRHQEESLMVKQV